MGDPDVKLFSSKKAAAEQVLAGQFEFEQDGHVATLDYMLDGKVLTLLETSVPEALRGAGIAGTLAQSALDFARERGLKVDVICPFVSGYLKTHPEYADLVLR